MIRVNRTFVEKINSRQYPHKIQTIFEEEVFKTETIKEEIIFTLNRLNISEDSITKEKRRILSLFQLTREEKKKNNRT